MTTITDLRRKKKQWMGKTVSRNYLKKKMKFSDEEIEKIKKDCRYGKERYQIDEVLKFSQRKNK